MWANPESENEGEELPGEGGKFWERFLASKKNILRQIMDFPFDIACEEIYQEFWQLIHDADSKWLEGEFYNWQ